MILDAAMGPCGMRGRSVPAGLEREALATNAAERFWGRCVSCTCQHTSVKVIPVHSQLQRQPHKVLCSAQQVIGVTARTSNEVSYGNQILSWTHYQSSPSRTESAALQLQINSICTTTHIHR